MTAIQEWINKRLQEGQKPESIEAYLRTYGYPKELAKQLVRQQEQIIKPVKIQNPHKLHWLEILLFTALALFFLIAGYKIGEQTPIKTEMNEITDYAFYTSKLAYFEGKLINYNITSWTMQTNRGEITLTTPENNLPTIRYRNQVITEQPELKEGDRVTIYTEIDSKNRMVVNQIEINS